MPLCLFICLFASSRCLFVSSRAISRFFVSFSNIYNTMTLTTSCFRCFFVSFHMSFRFLYMSFRVFSHFRVFSCLFASFRVFSYFSMTEDRSVGCARVCRCLVGWSDSLGLFCLGICSKWCQAYSRYALIQEASEVQSEDGRYDQSFSSSELGVQRCSECVVKCGYRKC